MHFIMSIGDVVLADRIPEEHFKMFMQFCRGGRLLLKPSELTEREFSTIDSLLTRFCDSYVKQLYDGKEERLMLCWLTTAALLDGMSFLVVLADSGRTLD